MKLSIVIPVFNEEKTVSEILRRIEEVDLSQLGFEKEIIIVDDGSTDGTRQILKGFEDKYKVIYHSQNQGKGMATRTGLGRVTGDYVIIQDADLEYDPQDYKKLLSLAIQNKAEVVYGYRELNSKDKPSHWSYYDRLSRWSYYAGGIVLNWLTNIILGIKIKDESTCYKLFKTETIKSIPLESKRFEFCPEITAKVVKRGIKIYEVPISYTPRSKKEGKKINWRDGVVALWTLIKYKFLK